jgi:hypothetical protein
VEVEGKEGVKVKSVEIIPNSNTNSTSNSKSKSTLPLPAPAPGQGQGKPAGGAVNGVLTLGGSSNTSSAAAVLTAANTSFELTPLSGLIKQSYKDIGTLRVIQAEREKLVREGRGVGVGDAGGIGGREEIVDFDEMEEHLRRFEEVYRQVFTYSISHPLFPLYVPISPFRTFLSFQHHSKIKVQY